jgi:FkbM family methyltransferase
MQKLLQKSIHFIPLHLRSRIHRIPVLAAAQRALLASYVDGKEFIHRIDAGPGCNLTYPVLMPDDKGVWTGNYESEFVTALAESVQTGSVCFDIGGWRGYCGGVMAVRGASKVVIFEPLPDNIARIQRLIELNPSLASQLVQGAAGEVNGEATFVVMDATSMGKLSNSPFQDDITTESRIPVSVYSIDRWCEANDSEGPDVMKIDVEGAEMMVLKGAATVLQKKHPRLFIESHSRELTTDVTDFLSDFGYILKTMETGSAPDGQSEPPVCHLIAD